MQKEVGGYNNNVMQIGFQKDVKWIYTCSEDGTVRIHDFRQNGFARMYSNKVPVNTAVLHPNEAEIIAGDAAGNIKIYDLQADKCRATITLSQDIAIRSISIAQNAYCLVAANSLGMVYAYTLKNTEELIPFQEKPYFPAHNDYILKCAISPDVRKLATCSADKTVKLWNLEDDKNDSKKFTLDKTLYGHSKFVWDCVFSCDSDLLITVSSDQ